MKVMAALALAAMLAGTGFAPPARTITFEGTVVDSRLDRVPSAIVTLDGGTLDATADTKGRFQMDGVSIGPHVLTVKLPDGGIAKRDIEIRRSPTEESVYAWARQTSGALAIEIPSAVLGVSVEIKVLGEDIVFSSTDLVFPETDDDGGWASLWPVYLIVLLVAWAIVWKIRKDRRVH